MMALVTLTVMVWSGDFSETRTMDTIGLLIGCRMVRFIVLRPGATVEEELRERLPVLKREGM